MRIKGEQLLAFYQVADGDYRIVANSTDCSISLHRDIIPICSLYPGVSRSRTARSSWATAVSIYPTELPLEAGTPITIAISVLGRNLVNAGIDIQTITPDEATTLIGEAIVTSIKIQGSRGLLSRLEVALQGNGGLTAIGETKRGFPYSFPIIF